jgi:hypothetical protein
MYYIFIVGTLFFVANSCAMETNHQSLSPLTLRLTLCAKTNSNFLRDQMDRISSPPSLRKNARNKQKHKKSNKKSATSSRQSFFELPRTEQGQYLKAHQLTYLVDLQKSDNH